MSKAEAFFIQLIQETPGVKGGKMFGALCMKAPNGKAAAMLWKDCMVVKLTGEAFNEALSLDGSLRFEPMEGRPMKEWVQIPFYYHHLWKKFASISASEVKELKSKKKL